MYEIALNLRTYRLGRLNSTLSESGDLNPTASAFGMGISLTPEARGRIAPSATKATRPAEQTKLRSA